jgi:hypothetical protein
LFNEYYYEEVEVQKLIQGIFSLQFNLNQKVSGEIEPEFRPLELIFQEESTKKDNYLDLIAINDLFATFYSHTTGIYGVDKGQSNFYTGKLKESPYQIVSYYKQVSDGSHFLAISVFEIDDELELFDELIKYMGSRLNTIFEKLKRAENTKQLSLYENLKIRLRNELKYTIFQIERLSRLDKLQKIALIFRSEERVAILEALREYPLSRNELKRVLEDLNVVLNIDVLIQPFLELNLVRRDWIKGGKDKRTGELTNQGEYLFLIKDVILARIPNQNLLKHFKETKSNLLPGFQKKVNEFFSNYNPFTQSSEETKRLATLLLNPDIYDFFILLRTNHYPLDKIPKIFSEFAITEVLIEELKKLNIITEVKDKSKRSWIMLLTDIKPITIFPEYLLPKIREAYRNGEKEGKITYEIAKKALDLLELTYPEKITF